MNVSIQGAAYRLGSTPQQPLSWLVAARSNLGTGEAESARIRSISSNLAARRRLAVCWLRGKVTTRVFLLGWKFFLTAYVPGTFPTKNGWVSGRMQREALPTLTRTHARVHAPRSFGVAWTRETGRRVVTPASAGARPSASAISAGRSAGTRTPAPAAPSAAKGDPPPLRRQSQTPGRSQAWSRPSQRAGAGGLRPAPVFVTLNLQITKSLGPAGCGS